LFKAVNTSLFGIKRRVFVILSFMSPVSVFIVFATRICYIVQLPRILTLVYCNRCYWCSGHCQSSEAQKKNSFYKNVYLSV